VLRPNRPIRVHGASQQARGVPRSPRPSWTRRGVPLNPLTFSLFLALVFRRVFECRTLPDCPHRLCTCFRLRRGSVSTAEVSVSLKVFVELQRYLPPRRRLLCSPAPRGAPFPPPLEYWAGVLLGVPPSLPLCYRCRVLFKYLTTFLHAPALPSASLGSRVTLR